MVAEDKRVSDLTSRQEVAEMITEAIAGLSQKLAHLESAVAALETRPPDLAVLDLGHPNTVRILEAMLVIARERQG